MVSLRKPVCHDGTHRMPEVNLAPCAQPVLVALGILRYFHRQIQKSGVPGSGSGTPRLMILEDDACAKPNIALARARCRSDEPEGAGIRDVGSRVAEVRVVQGIQELPTEL